MKDIKQSNANVSDAKIDAIKQLIFGENIADYNDRFDAFEKTVDKVKRELENKLSDLESKLSSTINTLKSDYESNVARLEKKFEKEMTSMDDKKTDRKVLGKLLESVGSKLQA